MTRCQHITSEWSQGKRRGKGGRLHTAQEKVEVGDDPETENRSAIKMTARVFLEGRLESSRKKKERKETGRGTKKGGERVTCHGEGQHHS